MRTNLMNGPPSASALLPSADDLVEELAGALRAAQASRQPMAPIREQLAAGGIIAAYAVQQANTRRRLADGRRLVGRKIGLTSKAVQTQLGVDQPDYGALFDDLALCDGDEVQLARLLQPRVEAEVAFVMGRDLTSLNPSPAEVLRAVEFVLPAIEIVDSRIARWDIKLLDTVADNASFGMFVVGNEPRRLEGLDLRGCTMTMRRADQVVSSGTGAACLGHPVNALVWLARKLVEMGESLREGDVVMSGALGAMVKAEAGDPFEARIEGLGSVRVAFTS